MKTEKVVAGSLLIASLILPAFVAMADDSSSATGQTPSVAPATSAPSNTAGQAIKDAESQIKALRSELQTKIKALQADYQARIDAIRKAANLQAADIRAKAKEATDTKKAEMKAKLEQAKQAVQDKKMEVKKIRAKVAPTTSATPAPAVTPAPSPAQ